MKRILMTGMVTGALVALAACSTDRLSVPNFQNPTVGSITGDPVAALPLLATGVLRDDRGNAPGYVLGLGILGREVYNYTPTEGRNTSGWLTSDVNNNTSFGGGALWGGPYATLRDIFNTSSVLESATSSQFSDAQKNAVRGFLHTTEAYSDLQLINTRNDLGMVVLINKDPNQLSAFVTRDSAFNYIVGELNKAQTELTAAGTTAFPFTFHSGYTGFNTPATYIKFNRALAARVNAYRASLGVGGCAVKDPVCYQAVLTNLSQSFLDTTKALTLGVYQVFSAAAGDLANTNSNQNTSAIVAHFKADSGIQLRADGTKDLRFQNKVITIPAKGPSTPALGVQTTLDYSIYALRTDPIAIIRNEELILLRAEAEYYTGDFASALADINEIRTKSGGLAPRGAFNTTTDADFLDELLYNRRESLEFEGHRWIDMRRFGRLNQLTIDTNSPAYAGGGSPHVVVSRLPIPQAECLQRATAAANLKAPGC